MNDNNFSAGDNSSSQQDGQVNPATNQGIPMPPPPVNNAGQVFYGDNQTAPPAMATPAAPMPNPTPQPMATPAAPMPNPTPQPMATPAAPMPNPTPQPMAMPAAPMPNPTPQPMAAPAAPMTSPNPQASANPMGGMTGGAFPPAGQQTQAMGDQGQFAGQSQQAGTQTQAMGGQTPQSTGQGVPTPPVPPAKEEDKTPANYQLGKLFNGQYNIPQLKHNLNFDEKYFIELLAGSISLSKAEKKRILDSIPKLKQSQIDELINIFEDERKKFAELPQKHTKELERLAVKHHADWLSIEDDYKADDIKKEEEGKADEIRKQLGL